MTDPNVIDLRDPEEYGLACAECNSQNWVLMMDGSVFRKAVYAELAKYGYHPESK